MSIEIRRVESRRELRSFINFPLGLQKNYPNWVPALYVDEMNTLDRKKNPAFEFCEAEYWLAYKDGKLAGRIAGLINRRVIEKWGKKSARFGWMDFIEDYEVAEALVKTVEAWALAKGMDFVNGPMGFTDLDKEGLLIEGFDELGTMPMIYNPPYYPVFLERLGYAKDIDWLEFEVKVPDSIPEKAKRIQNLIAQRSGIHLYEWKTPRELKEKYAKALFDLVDQAYAHLYGTSPLSERQIDAYISQYLGFADPRFIKVVVDKEDKLVAFGISIPDLSKALQKGRGRLFPFGWYHLLRALKKPTTIDFLLIAVQPQTTARGAVAFLMSSLIESCIQAGVKKAETSGELETNHQVQSLWNDFEHRQHKRRRAYLKKL
jgi:hypothetical protein